MARRNAVRVKFEGLKEVEQRLTAVGLTLKSPEVVREIQRGAEVMAARARTRAPSDTGKLRRASIRRARRAIASRSSVATESALTVRCAIRRGGDRWWSCPRSSMAFSSSGAQAAPGRRPTEGTTLFPSQHPRNATDGVGFHFAPAGAVD